MRMAYLLLEVARKLVGRRFRSRLCTPAPSVFLFSGDDEGHGLLLGFFLSLICWGNWGDSDVKLVFSGFLCLRFLCFSVYFLSLFCWVSSLCLALFFPLSCSVFLPVLLSVFLPGWGRLCSAFIEPAAASVVVTAAPSPKCSVTDALNEENVRHVRQRTKRLCL
jgi:hypothetical protein